MLKLYKGLGRYKGSLILIVLLLCVQAMSMLLLPDMMAGIIDRGVVEGNIGYIMAAGLWMLGITLAGSLSSIGVGYLSAKVGVGFCTDVRKRLFAHIDTFTLGEFDQIGTASLVTRSTNDVQQVQTYTVMLFRVIVLSPIMCAGGLILAFSTNPGMGLVILGAIAVVCVVLPIVLRRAFPLFRQMQDRLDDVNVILRENVTGVRVIRAFDAQEREEARFEKANVRMTDVSIRSQTIMSTLMPILMFIINMGTIAVVWFGGNEIGAGQMQVGTMMAFIQYLVLIMYSLIMLSLILAMLPRASVCASRIQEVLDIQPSITNPEHPVTPEEKSGVVEFDNVALAYHDSDHPAIEGISFTAHPGKTTAIIGATGSGKSSIVCLVPRLRDATRGTVRVDGVDVRNYDLHALRSRIAYVPQKANLFAGTIRSNIAYADEDMPMERVEKAAEVAQATDFILKKEKGFDDPISQGGTNVSGGQRQRLTIARAIAEGGQIMVFDDSFSALDFQTDARLRHAIRQNSKDATIIIVAQRINTILSADEILVLDAGRVVGRGTHQELLKSCPEYQEIARTQLGAEAAS